MTTYTLSKGQIERAESKLMKLQNKARKLGTMEPELLVREEVYITIIDPDTLVPHLEKRYVCELTGTEPVIAGYEFVGTVEHEKAGNIVRLSPLAQKLELDTVAYREGAQKCEHCGTIRARKDTFLVREVPDENQELIDNYLRSIGQAPNRKIIQVGSSCLRDFLGHGDPESVVNYIEALQEFIDEADLDGFRGGGMSSDRYLNTQSYLEQVAAMLRTHGWVSKRAAIETDRISTVERVEDNLWKLEHPNDKHTLKEPYVEPDETDRDLAYEALVWLNSTIGTIPANMRNDYQHSLYVAASNREFNVRTKGIVASLLATYRRTLAEEVERANKPVSAHVGVVGKRQTFQHVLVTRVFDYDNDFGVSHRHMMQTPEGNVLTWQTGTIRLDEGGLYTVIGTVQDHTEYKGTKQTKLTRCKVGVDVDFVIP